MSAFLQVEEVEWRPSEDLPADGECNYHLLLTAARVEGARVDSGVRGG